MNIRVRFGAGLTAGHGLARISVTMPAGASVGDLVEYLITQYPANPALKAAVPVINGMIVSADASLVDQQEVALLLPISGG